MYNKIKKDLSKDITYPAYVLYVSLDNYLYLKDAKYV